MKDDTTDKTIEVFINPLAFLEVDEPWASCLKKPATYEDIVKLLCTPGIEPAIDKLIDRYKQISQEKVRLFAVPYHERIMEKMIWPLRHAKTGYMVGNYLGTISLCGMVAEMIAVLFFEMSNIRLNNKTMEEKDQESVFGNTFEKLGQERRIRILHAYGIIDKELKDSFDLIRERRRRYLHLWTHDHDKLPVDAIKVFDTTVTLVVRAIGQNIKDGKLILNPALVEFLKRSEVPDREKK